MQQKPPFVKHSSIEEMDCLIKSIKDRDKTVQEKELAVSLGYGKGYFSECRSRNFAPNKLLNSLKAQVNSLRNTNDGEAAEVVGSTKDQDISKLIESNSKLADSIYDMVAMLKKKESDTDYLKTNLNKVLLNQYAVAAADREYQAYAIELFWKLQGQDVSGKEVVKDLNQKATDKFVQMQTQGISLD